MSIVLDQPDQIAMFGLLQARGSLHLELVGLRTRGGAIVPRLKRLGYVTSSDKFTALIELNELISERGGPSDVRSLKLQKRLALEGKRYEIKRKWQGLGN